MVHIMVDIEGMNKMPESHLTRIMQVAAMPFDEHGPLNHLPSFNDFLDRSRPSHTVDNPETVIWWRENPIWNKMQAQQDIRGVSPRGFCNHFNTYIESLQREHGDVTLWACHPEYDLTAIYAYMVAFNIKPAWPFYRVKDYATVRDRYKEALRQGKVSHWAHEDVLRQIDMLVQCCRLGWEL